MFTGVVWFVFSLFFFLIVADDILFKWASNRSKLLREFWEDYALVMETLEENQVENPTCSLSVQSWAS